MSKIFLHQLIRNSLATYLSCKWSQNKLYLKKKKNPTPAPLFPGESKYNKLKSKKSIIKLQNDVFIYNPETKTFTQLDLCSCFDDALGLSLPQVTLSKKIKPPSKENSAKTSSGKSRSKPVSSKTDVKSIKSKKSTKSKMGSYADSLDFQKMVESANASNDSLNSDVLDKPKLNFTIQPARVQEQSRFPKGQSPPSKVTPKNRTSQDFKPPPAAAVLTNKKMQTSYAFLPTKENKQLRNSYTQKSITKSKPSKASANASHKSSRTPTAMSQCSTDLDNFYFSDQTIGCFYKKKKKPEDKNKKPGDKDKPGDKNAKLEDKVSGTEKGDLDDCAPRHGRIHSEINAIRAKHHKPIHSRSTRSCGCQGAGNKSAANSTLLTNIMIANKEGLYTQNKVLGTLYRIKEVIQNKSQEERHQITTIMEELQKQKEDLERLKACVGSKPTKKSNAMVFTCMTPAPAPIVVPQSIKEKFHYYQELEKGAGDALKTDIKFKFSNPRPKINGSKSLGEVGKSKEPTTPPKAKYEPDLFENWHNEPRNHQKHLHSNRITNFFYNHDFAKSSYTTTARKKSFLSVFSCVTPNPLLHKPSHKHVQEVSKPFKKEQKSKKWLSKFFTMKKKRITAGV